MRKPLIALLLITLSDPSLGEQMNVSSIVGRESDLPAYRTVDAISESKLDGIDQSLIRYIKWLNSKCFTIQTLSNLAPYEVMDTKDICALHGNSFRMNGGYISLHDISATNKGVEAIVHTAPHNSPKEQRACVIPINGFTIGEMICGEPMPENTITSASSAIPDPELPPLRTIDAVRIINLERHKDTLIRYIKWQHSQCFTVQVLSSDSPWGVLSSKDICEFEGNSFLTGFTYSAFEDISLTAKGIEATLDIFPFRAPEELRNCVIPINGAVIGPLTCGEPRPVVSPDEKREVCVR